MSSRVIAPWKVARRHYEDPVAKDSPTGQIAFWRGVVGLITVGIVEFSHGGIFAITVGDPIPLAVATLATIVVISGFVYAIADEPTRGMMRSGASRPATILGRLAVFVGIPVVIGLTWQANGHPEPSTIAAGVFFAVMMIYALWLLIYLPFSAYHLSRYAFHIGHMHPMLPPICTVAAVVLLAVLRNLNAGPSAVPTELSLFMTIVGVITTAAVAIFEYRQLHDIGYRLTEMPRPATD